MKKKYLKITVISHSGFKSENPLMPSEVGNIIGLASNNKSLIVKEVECEPNEYFRIFGE